MKLHVTVVGANTAELRLKLNDEITKLESIISMKDLAKIYETVLSALRMEASYQKVEFLEFVNKLLEDK